MLKGEPLRAVGKRYGFSEDTIGRHRRHMQVALSMVAKPESVNSTETLGFPCDYGNALLKEVNALKRDALRLQKQAEAERDLRTAIKAFDSRLRVVEVQARLTGAIETSSKSVNLNLDVQVSEADAARIVTAYLATRQPPALCDRSHNQPAQSPADAPQEGEPCNQSKSNGKIN